MISKELLSLILDKNIIAVRDYNIPKKDNHISYELKDGWASLNLDTLGRLCKEWCRDNNYYIKSHCAIISDKGETNIGFAEVIICGEPVEYISEDTELESVIAATKWVAIEKDLL